MYIAASHAPQPKAKPHGKRTLTFFHPPLLTDRGLLPGPYRSMAQPIRDPIGPPASPPGHSSVCSYHNIGSPSLRCCVRPCYPQARPTAITWGWKRPRPFGPPLLPSSALCRGRKSAVCPIHPLAGEIFVSAPSFSEVHSAFSDLLPRWFCERASARRSGPA